MQTVIVARPELNNGRALILFTRDTRWGELVVACSTTARAAGVRLEMPLAEATALVERRGAWFAAAHDPQADRAALTHLAECCQRFSPLVGWETVAGKGTSSKQAFSLLQRDAAVLAPDFLLLEITSIGRLFGGEGQLATAVLAELRQHGYHAAAAIAPTIGAAWGLARETKVAEVQIVNDSSSLAALPLAALRLSAGIIDRLTQLGIQQFSALLMLPRASLTARFGEELLLRIDQAQGTAAETIVPWHPPPQYAAEIAFEDPVEDRLALEQAAASLLQQLAAELTAAQQGALRFVCRFDCEQEGVAGQPLQLRIGLFRPSASAAHWQELLQMQLEQAALRGSVGRLTIHVLQTGPLEQRQHDLFPDATTGSQHALATLVDRLSSRLGEDRVISPQLRADPLPERAWRAIPSTKASTRNRRTKSKQASSKKKPAPESTDESNPASFPAARPLQLFQPPIALEVIALAPDGPPQVFRWRGKVHRVALFWGPERIETGWWRGRSVQRDYYRVETETGLRYWLFRERVGRTWHLHGAFE